VTPDAGSTSDDGANPLSVVQQLPTLLYDVVAGAYESAQGHLWPGEAEHGPLPPRDRFSPVWGGEPPPPLHGGRPYYALAILRRAARDCHEALLDLPNNAQALPFIPSTVGLGALAAVAGALGRLAVLDMTVRECWDTASQYVDRWYGELSRACADIAVEAGVPPWSEALRRAPLGLPPPPLHLHTWLLICELVECHQQWASALAARAQALEGAAAEYIRAVGQVPDPSASTLEDCVEAIHALAAAGAALSAASAGLNGPAFAKLVRESALLRVRHAYPAGQGEPRV